jgi:hypothetical protein
MAGISLHKTAGQPNWSKFWRDYWRNQTRPSPAGALDEKPRRQARDQQSGKLDGAYCRATDQFLRDNGLPDEDVEAISQILAKYAEEPAEDENLEMREDPRVRVGGTRGTVGASDRRMALDTLDLYGRPRSLPATPMLPGGDDRGFTERFPDAAKIRTL